MKAIIDKLRHLLVNDPENCHDYIFKFMMQYFTIVEIGQFTEEELRTFITAVGNSAEGVRLNPRKDMKEVIRGLMTNEHILIEEPSVDEQVIAINRIIAEGGNQEFTMRKNSISSTGQGRKTDGIESAPLSEAKEMMHRYSRQEVGSGILFQDEDLLH